MRRFFIPNIITKNKKKNIDIMLKYIKTMFTEILKTNEASIKKAAALIKAGETAAFPTETVYGLGANALSEAAVKKIFDAKGRPSDNPLIVHVSCLEDVYAVALDIPQSAKKLIGALGPAPLTYIVKKSDKIPAVVTAGLDTVAVRIPAHPAALALIRECGLPIAAPSANGSGRPSPTSAAHVFADLNGKIPLILDGGECGMGVESTVVDFTLAVPMILRPGGFSKEALEEILGDEVKLYKTALNGPAKSPGLKYGHYAPRCKIEVIPYSSETIQSLIAAYDYYLRKNIKSVIICAYTYVNDLGGREYVSLGKTAAEAARSLFKILRENEDRYDVLVCHTLPEEGVGRAFNDRLLRAAAVNKFC